MYWNFWVIDRLLGIGQIREAAILRLGIWNLKDHPELWSYAAIEILIFILAFVLVRDALRADRADAVKSPAQRPGFDGSLADATGLLPPRLWFMARTLLFTFLVELSLSNAAGLDRSMYIAANPVDQVPYVYPPAFAISILGVPLWVPVGWTVVIFYLSAITSDSLIRGTASSLLGRLYTAGIVRAFCDASLALAIDLVMDPIAQAEGWWVWTERAHGFALFSVPVTNFIAWFGIVFSLSLVTRSIRIVLPRAQSWRTQPFMLLLEGAGMLLALLFVTQLVDLAHWIDRGESSLATNATLLLAALLFVGGLAAASRYPWSIDAPYSALIGRSVVALQGLFVLIVVTRLLTDRFRAGSALVDVHPELVIWIPGVALVSLLLFLMPYLKSLARDSRASRNVVSLARLIISL